jgi:hypothetical protein
MTGEKASASPRWEPPAEDQAERDLLEDHFWLNRNAPEGPRHSHMLQGQSLTHSHPGGDKPHAAGANSHDR